MKKISMLYTSNFAKGFAGLTLCSMLYACGFTPMYSTDTGGGAAHGDIFVAPISGTNGIDLRNALVAKFGSDIDNAAAQYKLTVNLKKPETTFKGLQITGDATWQEVRLTATYELKDAKTGTVILSATDNASESYTFVRDLVAANASYNNAIQNAVRILSEEIETRVNAKLATN